jgi:hypothetical protein
MQTGIPILPVYKLGPLRILVTIIGVAISFIFAIIPFPITSKDSLRRHIARQFYLLSNLFSLTQARFIAAVEGNLMQKTLNNRASLKCFEVQGHCKECLLYASWEPNLQYRFPKQIYIELLSSMQTYSPK